MLFELPRASRWWVDEILTKHLTEAPDLTKVPLEYQSAIRKALEKDAGKRY